jgi:DNA-binding PadR family transcriptional regulator
LERSGYVDVRKRFIGRRPNTSYAVTESGRQAFARHLDALERMIREGASPAPGMD